jgi:hypothetical protein
VKDREKMLGFGVLAIAAVVVCVLVVRSLVVKPVKALDSQIAQLRLKLSSINTERNNFFAAEKSLKEYGKRTFAPDMDTANAQAGVALNELILRVGLSESDFTRIPASPRKMAGAREVGWLVQGEGALGKTIDLLFLLEQTPVLHRIQRLSLAPSDRPGRVRTRFSYLTLVLDPAPSATATNTAPLLALGGKERQAFQPIVRRDLFRPYVKRENPPETPAAAPAAVPGAGLRVVSLSEWNGASEVHVLDSNSQKTRICHPGDTLADAVVVMVDYRPLPKPGGNGLLSDSRVILKEGDKFWAIERGQTLAERYQLTPEQLPSELSLSKSAKP